MRDGRALTRPELHLFAAISYKRPCADDTDGKEGVDGSSPSEGSEDLPLVAGHLGLTRDSRPRPEARVEAFWKPRRRRVGPCARLGGISGLVVQRIHGFVRSPCTGAAPTPDLVTVVDERRQIGSNPAGGGVGSAGAPRGRMRPPPPCQQDEGLDRGEQKTALASHRVGGRRASRAAPWSPVQS